jgi:small-conductance mechanosensitive channel|tara:strand:+ start:331 stop:585 length:255 start_codon:yes stop_codon:yes gene_type:complete
MTTQENQEEQPQIPVTDADFAELFRRMPHARAELNAIVQTRVAFEMQNKEIEDLRKQVEDKDRHINDILQVPSVNKKADKVATG